MAFAELGFDVGAICPRGHPLHAVQCLLGLHRYEALYPERALAAAIARWDPALVIPCDDRAVAHLHSLHARGGAALQDLIERSLGPPTSFAVTPSRCSLIDAARAAGIRAPETHAVSSDAALGAALSATGYPAVLKVDGTWGGLGVAVAGQRATAERARRRLAQPLGLVRAAKRLLVDRDAFHLRVGLARKRPVVSLQRFVHGHPANCIAACWQGQVVALIAVKVMRAQHSLGASTIVRVGDYPEIGAATTRLVAKLGLSGFCGIDFIIDDAGAAHLIELNARATPLAHLGLGPGRDPVAALAACMTGAAISARPAMTDRDIIAFFPQAWLRGPADPLLAESFHDVPWQEPSLVRDLVRLPYPERGTLARLTAAWRCSDVTAGLWSMPDEAGEIAAAVSGMPPPP